MSYNYLQPFHFITAQSMTTSSTSVAVEIQEQDNIGIQLNWTGTPNGAFTFQVSADHLQDAQGNIQVAGNWITLTLNPTINAVGAADSAYIDFNQLSARYIRVVYTASSSTGTLDGYVTGKGV